MLIIFVILIYIIIGTMTSNFMYDKWEAEKLRCYSSDEGIACGVFWPFTLTIVFGNWLYKIIFKRKH